MKIGNKIALVIAPIVGILFLIVVFPISDQDEYSELQSLSNIEFQAMAIDWQYDDILRNFEKYEGKIIRM